MSEHAELPGRGETERGALEHAHESPGGTYRYVEAEDRWRDDVLATLRGILACVERLSEAAELPAMIESAAARREPPESAEPLPTWILTDASVQRVEEAIEAEQRVRGRAYGG